MQENKPLIKAPESTVFIRFQDCDPMGHLNNARYVDYFLNAREEHTRQHYALNLLELSNEFKANWVVTNHQIAYIRPADLGETVHIQTKLIHFDNSSIVLESIMFNAKRTKIKSFMWSTLRYVSLETGKTTDHPDKVMDLLEQLDTDDMHYDEDGFQERIKGVSKKLKLEEDED